MKYKTIIIDDESKLREVLAIKLSQHCPDLEIVGKAADVPEAYAMIKEKVPDIIFLDIAMPGETGFDLLQKFEKIDFEVIFATGFNEYALDALKVSAVDYILKPIKTEELTKAVDKAISNLEDKNRLNRYEVLKQNIDKIGDQDTKIAIPSSDAYDFVKISEIIRCEGWQKYTKIHLHSGDTIVSSYNIGVYKDMLEKYDFFSTHKSHLVNLHLIDRYMKEGNVIMSDGSSVPVSRRKKDLFLKQVLNKTA